MHRHGGFILQILCLKNKLFILLQTIYLKKKQFKAVTQLYCYTSCTIQSIVEGESLEHAERSEEFDNMLIH
jgi:hypothetical protein